MNTTVASTPLLDGEGKNRRVYFSLFTRDVFGLIVSSQAGKRNAHWSPGNDSSACNHRPTIICMTTPPSIATFTRPGSNIVANFVFINV